MPSPTSTAYTFLVPWLPHITDIYTTYDVNISNKNRYGTIVDDKYIKLNIYSFFQSTVKLNKVSTVLAVINTFEFNEIAKMYHIKKEEGLQDKKGWAPMH